ncbi:MAG: hypothetical protein K0Q92_2663, partial [Steroidobacteraceae bacterium]|nr:hypothetical protein [Steroidobacteraceae bacterium]
AADGEHGVSLALEIIRKELEISMALTGCVDARHISAGCLVRESLE